MIPYVTPTDVRGNPSAPAGRNVPSDAATLGFDAHSIEYQRLWEMCQTATNICDQMAGLSLRATSLYEELYGPGHRLANVADGSALRFVTSRKPILSVLAGQVAHGGPPFSWTAIPAANLAPEQPPFTDVGSAGWDFATSGQAAILIGSSPISAGTRIGVTYLSGWPVAGITPAASPSGTVTGTFPNTTTVTGLSVTAGIAPGAPVTGEGIPEGTTVVSINTGAESLVLSNPAPAAGEVALTIGYAPGATTLNVDDVTAWTLGISGEIADGTYTESVTSTAAVANAPAGQLTPQGPGVVTLASPTVFAHRPGRALTAMPYTLRWVALLGVKAQALERGATALTSQGAPGRSTSSGASAITRIYEVMRMLIAPYRRVI